ncbi:MAG: hypothetical protein ACQCN4_02625 [Candidatus Bathyarchaeia archaeon]
MQALNLGGNTQRTRVLVGGNGDCWDDYEAAYVLNGIFLGYRDNWIQLSALICRPICSRTYSRYGGNQVRFGSRRLRTQIGH